MIENRIKKIMELEAQMKELEKAKKAVEDELKADMEANGETVRETAKGAKVLWREVTTDRFDTTRFKKLHADMYADFVKTTTSRRFNYYPAN
jgi:predicted phage-related endonuclease